MVTERGVGASFQSGDTSRQTTRRSSAELGREFACGSDSDRLARGWTSAGLMPKHNIPCGVRFVWQEGGADSLSTCASVQ